MPRCYDGSETFLSHVTHRDIRDTCVTCHVSHIPQSRARCYNQTMTLIVFVNFKFRRLSILHWCYSRCRYKGNNLSFNSQIIRRLFVKVTQRLLTITIIVIGRGQKYIIPDNLQQLNSSSSDLFWPHYNLSLLLRHLK